MLHFLRVVVNRNFTTKRFQGYCKATKYYRTAIHRVFRRRVRSMSSESASPYWIVAKWLNIFLDGHGRDLGRFDSLRWSEAEAR
jgi:hypothetical protein